MARHRAPQGAMPVWRVWLLDGWWEAAGRLPWVWRLSSRRCPSYRPARCFIHTPGVFASDGTTEGYYRWGILAQYCVRFAGHRGSCVSPISADGEPVPGGVVFEPERAWQEEETVDLDSDRAAFRRMLEEG